MDENLISHLVDDSLRYYEINKYFSIMQYPVGDVILLDFIDCINSNIETIGIVSSDKLKIKNIIDRIRIMYSSIKLSKEDMSNELLILFAMLKEFKKEHDPIMKYYDMVSFIKWFQMCYIMASRSKNNDIDLKLTSAMFKVIYTSDQEYLSMYKNK